MTAEVRTTRRWLSAQAKDGAYHRVVDRIAVLLRMHLHAVEAQLPDSTMAFLESEIAVEQGERLPAPLERMRVDGRRLQPRVDGRQPADTLGEARSATVTRRRTQQALIIGQFALSMAVLTGATLLVRTLVNLRTTDLGFDSKTLALERTLSDSLGLDVTVSHRANGGYLRINYKTLEQLEEICRLLERR